MAKEIGVHTFFRRLGLIVWKNLYLRKNQWCVTTFEVFFPAFLLLTFIVANLHPPTSLDDRNITYPSYDFGLKWEDDTWCNDNYTSFDPKTDNVLAYTPDNAQTAAVMQQLAKVICPPSRSKQIEITGVPDVSELEERYNEDWAENARFRGAIVFTDGLKELQKKGSNKGVISYAIRTHAVKVPNTRKVLPTQSPLDRDFIRRGPPRTESGYYDDTDYLKRMEYVKSKFVHLQLFLDKVLAQKLTLKDFPYNISLQALPYAQHFPAKSGSLSGLSIFMGVAYGLGLCFMIPSVTRNVVSEKQTGISELLRMSGVSGAVQWLGWLIHVSIPQLITVFLLTLVLVVRIADEAVFEYADVSLVLLVLFLFMSASAAMCFFICSLFQKPTIATTVAELLFLAALTYGFFYPAMLFRTLPPAAKFASAMLPNFALNVIMHIFAYLQQNPLDDSDFPAGARWEHVATPVIMPVFRFPDEYATSAGDMILMLLADTVVYTALAVYLDCVMPSEHGVKRPWYLFNFGGRKRQTSAVYPGPDPSQTGNPTSTDTTVVVDASGESLPNKQMAVSGFEPEPVGAPVGVEVQNMVKKFGRYKTAVNGVSLRMFAGDIFALLGHNGAGKTTLISMLTGFFSPTSGTAVINGHDIKQDLEKARESLGLCPQHNMLFDWLTVYQQLRFFGMLRGLSLRQSRAEADMLMMQMHFMEKARTLAKKLSGGQKRKLSLGMALIGGTKVVILDEPTSGMDPQARREIWDILLELRKQRTILLTTHFMEEADVLGDRIGIMAHGALQCCGSSDFLKKYYGAGYTLKVTFLFLGNGPEAPASDEVPASSDSKQDATEDPIVAPIPFPVKPSPQAEAVLALVQKHVPTANFKMDRHSRSAFMSNQAFIALPGETATTSILSQLFADLIPRKEKLGIATIGLSEASMDEVFIKVGEMVDDVQAGNLKLDEEMFLARSPKQYRKGLGRLFGQFLSLLVKKFLYATRKWALLLFEIVVPIAIFILFAYFSCNFLLFERSSSNNPGSYGRTLDATGRMSSALSTPSVSGTPLKISFDSYPSPITFYSEEGNPPSAVSQYLASLPGAELVSNVTREVLELGNRSIVSYKRNCIVGLEVHSNLPNTSTINALLNLNPYHAAPLAMNVATNAILKALDPSANYTLQMTVHPFAASSSRLEPEAEDESHDYPRSLSDQNGGRDYDDYGGRRRDPSYQRGGGGGGVGSREFPMLTASMISLAVVFLVANFVVNPIEEKLCQAKQLQTMTGVNPLVYWGTAFLWDYVMYLVVVLLMIIYLPLYEYVKLGKDYWVLSRGYGLPVLFWILVTYGFSAIFFSYLVSFRASSVAGGFTLVTLLHIMLGLLTGVALPDRPIDPDWADGILTFMKVISRMFPTYSLTRALWYYADIAETNSRIAEINSRCVPGTYDRYNEPVNCPEAEEFVVWSTEFTLPPASPFSPERVIYLPGIGQELFFIFLTGLVYFGLVMLLDFKIFRLFGSILCKDDGHGFTPNIRDDDVAVEVDRVNELVATRQIGLECLLVRDLCKSYGTFAAVNRLHFGVHHGECFGLLGINGAGKTTAFRMITGDEMPSLGTAFGFGTSLDFCSSRRFYSNIGYCPQFDGILPLLTGKQMLKLFAGLRGVPFRLRGMEAMTWLHRMGLADSAKVPCGKYSGGMKRRLSTAMAMIGDPPLILLDEPTSGVDPVSRRHFWKILEKLREGGQSFILTSHSMDECEALCSRLGIMVNGQFQCFGGVQHLKSKFAQGYSLTLKLKPDLPSESPELQQDIGRLDERMKEKFQPCELKDQHQTLVQYHLKNPLMTWDVLFKSMEEVKAEFPTLIDDYTVNETSLEEVFLAFAREQHPERKANVTLCKQICTCSC